MAFRDCCDIEVVPSVTEFNRQYVNPTIPDLEPSILETVGQTS